MSGYNVVPRKDSLANTPFATAVACCRGCGTVVATTDGLGLVLCDDCWGRIQAGALRSTLPVPQHDADDPRLWRVNETDLSIEVGQDHQKRTVVTYPGHANSSPAELAEWAIEAEEICAKHNAGLPLLCRGCRPGDPPPPATRYRCGHCPEPRHQGSL